MYALTAAHPTLQLPSVVEVLNLENGRSLILRINDRGPFVNNRLIDLSYAAARELGFERQGLAKVKVRYLGLARLDEQPIRPGEGRQYAAVSCQLPEPRRLVC
jgi:rare lipoprotein A